jgi:hypothetical protein
LLHPPGFIEPRPADWPQLPKETSSPGLPLSSSPWGGKPMDIINFYTRLNNISNNQAINDLAKLAGLR